MGRVLVACEESQAVTIALREREVLKHLVATYFRAAVVALNGTYKEMPWKRHIRVNMWV